MIDTIRTTIDSAGRVVIPKPVRDAAGLSARDEIEVRLDDAGVIELRALPRAVHLEDREGIQVAVPDEPSSPLTEAAVSAIRRSLRGEGREAARGA